MPLPFFFTQSTQSGRRCCGTLLWTIVRVESVEITGASSDREQSIRLQGGNASLQECADNKGGSVQERNRVTDVRMND